MTEEHSESRHGMPAIVWLAVAIPVLVFLPLGIAAVEHFVVGSDHFEELCRRVGVFDTLDRVYSPFVDLFR